MQDSYMKRHKNVNFGMQLIIFIPKKQIKCRFVYDILKKDTVIFIIDLSLMLHGTCKYF